ncbi:HYDROLASE ALPHA/BETA FOLD FAMILY PROTEIN EXPRESSED-RELATED [Salix koriyanagi]|uniref:HYDROLASE ALPHA/BETA FOLD FAMILY PROTEIN EXPRESSED-RELATED n=1 Tax=Salix koriyanagi TaxID=2511006 RepID=A0A9Q0TSZ3_9ROSI|nr:HYDROLASE ALPHA/BETA FOLD FAMILY PROTEIN EXPRESSED-RELATED [Salix koriyanagi]
MVYRATEPPPPQSDQSPDNPPGNSPRIKLRDGRYLAYREHGVPKNQSKYSVILVHGFGSSKEMKFSGTTRDDRRVGDIFSAI